MYIVPYQTWQFLQFQMFLTFYLNSNGKVRRRDYFAQQKRRESSMWSKSVNLSAGSSRVHWEQSMTSIASVCNVCSVRALLQVLVLIWRATMVCDEDTSHRGWCQCNVFLYIKAHCFNYLKVQHNVCARVTTLFSFCHDSQKKKSIIINTATCTWMHINKNVRWKHHKFTDQSERSSYVFSACLVTGGPVPHSYSPL